ncbi:MAG: stage III sporulation protein AA [Dethiobacteria bacterium]
MKKTVVEEQVLPLLAPSIRNILRHAPCPLLNKVQEIRLREARPLILSVPNGEVLLSNTGQQVKKVDSAYHLTHEDLRRTLALISSCSLYAFEEELRKGYLTVPGGHRVGLAGKVVVASGKVKLISEVTSLNFRIARAVTGVGDKVLPFLFDLKKGRFYHTLIISPPQAGKTTLLRDLCRLLSDGSNISGHKGFKVGIVDERSEIAACFAGVPQLPIGCRSDVLDGCPKAEGMMMLLRSMSPEIIATDEIGRSEDVQALEEVINAGVSILTTAHGSGLQELRRRPSLARMLDMHLFERIVVLSRRCGVGTVEKILDGDGQNLRPIGAGRR